MNIKVKGIENQGTRGKMDLNERSMIVLKSIIENYIKISEPVGSRTLSKAIGFKLSPATIRNIMSDLAESGYLIQTHTSAGRVPTDKAYRFYVDSISKKPAIPVMKIFMETIYSIYIYIFK